MVLYIGIKLFNKKFLTSISLVLSTNVGMLNVTKIKLYAINDITYVTTKYKMASSIEICIFYRHKYTNFL